MTNPAFSAWTEDDKQKLRDLAAAGKFPYEIAPEIGRTIASIRDAAKRYGIELPRQVEPFISRGGAKSGQIKKPVPILKIEGITPAEKIRLLLERPPELMTPEEATVAHLLDMKQAGHSPTRTELRVPSDGVAMRFSPEPFATYRSPAAMLAEG